MNEMALINALGGNSPHQQIIAKQVLKVSANQKDVSTWLDYRWRFVLSFTFLFEV